MESEASTDPPVTTAVVGVHPWIDFFVYVKCCTLGVVLYTKVKTDIHIDYSRSSEEIQTVSAVFLFVILRFLQLDILFTPPYVGRGSLVSPVCCNGGEVVLFNLTTKQMTLYFVDGRIC